MIFRWITGHYSESKGDFILYRRVARIFSCDPRDHTGYFGRGSGFDGCAVLRQYDLAVMLDGASLLITSQNVRRRLNIVTGAVLFIVAGLILIM